MARGRPPRPGRGGGRAGAEAPGSSRDRAPARGGGGEQAGTEPLGGPHTQQLEAQVADLRGQLTTLSGLFQQFLQQQAAATATPTPPPAQDTPVTAAPPATSMPTVAPAVTTTTTTATTTVTAGGTDTPAARVSAYEKCWRIFESSIRQGSREGRRTKGCSSIGSQTWRNCSVTFILRRRTVLLWLHIALGERQMCGGTATLRTSLGIFIHLGRSSGDSFTSNTLKTVQGETYSVS